MVGIGIQEFEVQCAAERVIFVRKDWGEKAGLGWLDHIAMASGYNSLKQRIIGQFEYLFKEGSSRAGLCQEQGQTQRRPLRLRSHFCRKRRKICSRRTQFLVTCFPKYGVEKSKIYTEKGKWPVCMT